MFLTVHHDLQGLLEADVAHVLGLFDGGQCIEHFLTEEAVARVGADGEVADTERGEVLEEMRALRGIDMVALECRLDDDAGGGDVRPLDGDAEPGVAGAPAAWADEDLVVASAVAVALCRHDELTVEEAAVDLFDLTGDLGVVGSGEVLAGLDIDHVDDIL